MEQGREVRKEGGKGGVKTEQKGERGTSIHQRVYALSEFSSPQL